MFVMRRLDDRGGRFVVHRQYLAINAPYPKGRGESRLVNQNETIWLKPLLRGQANPHTALTALIVEGRNDRAKENK
jgi:hypothetical protein